MLTLIGRPKAGGGETTLIPCADAPVRAKPSRLLIHLAGDFAPEIAAVWPEPHTPFVLAEAARRHLACLALSLGADSPVRPGPAFVAEALDGPFKRAVAALVPGAPKGLARALGRLGETAWTAPDYQRLVALLAQPAPAKVLNHAGSISRGEVATLASLPAALAEAGGTILRLSPDQARLVALCHGGIVARDGTGRAEKAARRWALAPTAPALLHQVREDIAAQRVEPFHPGSERLRPLATRAALTDAARRYNNCLEGREPEPDCHYYEWIGPPGVIVNVVRDSLWGWALEEGRLAGNAPVGQAERAAITAELRAMGVYVGPKRWTIGRMLSRACDSAYAFPDEDDLNVMAFEG